MNKKSTNKPEKPKPPNTDWDWVDEAGWESFPASDPPAIDFGFEGEPEAAPRVEP